MDAKLVANYITTLKEKSGLTDEIIAEKSGRSVATVKNLRSGKTEDPRLDTVAPVIYALGGSIDEMYTGKKDAAKEVSISSIKEIYEQQLLDMSKTHEAHVNNIRSHYEHHIEDLKENFKNRLADKDEIIKEKGRHGNFFKILACVGLAILVGLLIIEVMHPNLGWLRF